MAIGDLTLKTDGAERISKNLGMLVGEVDVGGAGVVAGISVTTPSATGKHIAGRKVSDFFETVLWVSVRATYPEAAAGGDVGVAGEHTIWEFDLDTDEIYLYQEDGTTGVTDLTTGTSVGVIQLCAVGLLAVNPSV